MLRIQHTVPNVDGWKHAFDGDPMDCKGSGVRRYQVYRSVADANLVMIDLEFETARRSALDCPCTVNGVRTVVQESLA